MLDIVERLCERVIILDHGIIVADGPTSALLSAANNATLEAVFHALTRTEDHRELAEAFLDSTPPKRADGPVPAV
jgi:ABC-type glutathione transport system ATPase component